MPRLFAGVGLCCGVLEIGSGAGANAAALLGRYDHNEMTLTDVDPTMRSRAETLLEAFGGRAQVVEADATALDFDDGSFDAVVSMLMLHHVTDRSEHRLITRAELVTGLTDAGFTDVSVRSLPGVPLMRFRAVHA